MSNDPTKNAIATLMQLAVGSTHKNMNIKLQVINTNSNFKCSNTKMYYTASLCDNMYKYCGFLIKKHSPEEEMLTKGDVVHISEVCVTEKKGSKVYKIFIICKFKVMPIKRKIFPKRLYNIAEEQNEFDKDKSYYYLNNNTNNNEDTNNNEEVEIVSNNSNSNSNECIEETINQTGSEDINSKNVLQTCPAIKSASEIPKFMQLNSVKPDTKEIVIYVKVIKKCEIKSFFNKVTKTKSKLLSFDICDSHGFEMQVSIFDRTCDKMAPFLKENEIYIFKGGYAKYNDKKYTNIKSEYKLIFDIDSEFLHVPKEIDTYFVNDFKRRKKTSNLVQIIDLPKYDNNTVIDALVYVIESYPKSVKQSRIGEVAFKRIIVGDISGFKCEFTLWKKFSDLNIKEGMIIFLNYIRINEYNGIRLSTVDDSNIMLNPKDEEDERDVEELEAFAVGMVEGINGLVWKDVNQYKKETKIGEVNHGNTYLNKDEKKIQSNGNGESK